METNKEEKLHVYGITVTVSKSGDATKVTITNDESVALDVQVPPERGRSPFSGCGAMC